MKRVTISLDDETFNRINEMGKMFELKPSQLIKAMMYVGLQVGDKMSSQVLGEFDKNIHN